jgi:predicted TIM-barrel fold metal-dependent hydrolase
MLISADSHVVEPDDLFTRALGRRWGDKLPQKVGRMGAEEGTFLFTGLEYIRMSGAIDVDDATAKTLDAANADPTLRLKCLDADGVWAEVLCATTMMLAMRAPDDALVHDCTRVFNDWLIEYCRQAPRRLYGCAMIHLADVDAAVAELERVAKAGMRCVMINNDARPYWPPLRSPHYDRFWAGAQALAMPVMLHIVCGNKRDFFTLHGPETVNAMRLSFDLYSEGPITLAAEFIFGGILDRFPDLRLVLGEFEANWLPFWYYRVDQMAEVYGPKIGAAKPKRPIREYLNRVYQGVIDDPYVSGTVAEILNLDTLMWGSDFPHPACTYPRSRQVVEEKFGRLGAAAIDKIARTNAARFYRIELPAKA